MPRDAGLEELIRDALNGTPGLSEASMFGGRAWLVRGNLLCGARTGRMMARLGKGNEGWGLATPGITALEMRGRPMQGWVWVAPEAYSDDALRRRLLDAALAFVATLPSKEGLRPPQPAKRTNIRISPTAATPQKRLRSQGTPKR